MASLFSFASIAPTLKSGHHSVIFQPTDGRKFCTTRCNAENPNTTRSNSSIKPPTNKSSTQPKSPPQNALLKIAWYGSELLGIAASFVRPKSNVEAPERDVQLARDGSGAVDRARIVQTIKDDFARSYFVTGNLTLDAYEEECEFADPAGSFKGLGRFKRNCTNFGLLIDKSNMKLMRWEDFEDKGIGHWRFGCIMSFPWKPILSATGYTEYYFDMETGKVCRHVEHWNVPKMALLKQILRPSRGLWQQGTSN